MASRKMRRRSTRRKSRKGGEGFGSRTLNPVTGKYEPMTPKRLAEKNAEGLAALKANPLTYDAETTARLAAEPDFDDDEDELDKMPDVESKPVGSFVKPKRGGRKTRKGKRGSRRR